MAKKTQGFWARLFGTSSKESDKDHKSTSSKGTQGGSHEQHVQAGHEGGKASHVCRGRECSSQHSGQSSHKS